MNSVAENLEKVRRRIRAAETRFHRPANSVKLLAVSKAQPAERVRLACAAGQRYFGESYLQEALGKIADLGGLDIEWHYIGRVQGNKTRAIAEHFEWIHSLDNARHARRLNDQRPEHTSPLKVCLQVNISADPNKGGLQPRAVPELLAEMRHMPRLSVAGLMCIPRHEADPRQQRTAFAAVRELRDGLATREMPLPTLSMGMSGDLEAAIAEGATIVRVGTAIFGPR